MDNLTAGEVTHRHIITQSSNTAHTNRGARDFGLVSERRAHPGVARARSTGRPAGPPFNSYLRIQIGDEHGIWCRNTNEPPLWRDSGNPAQYSVWFTSAVLAHRS